MAIHYHPHLRRRHRSATISAPRPHVPGWSVAVAVVAIAAVALVSWAVVRDTSDQPAPLWQARRPPPP